VRGADALAVADRQACTGQQGAGVYTLSLVHLAAHACMHATLLVPPAPFRSSDSQHSIRPLSAREPMCPALAALRWLPCAGCLRMPCMHVGVRAGQAGLASRQSTPLMSGGNSAVNSLRLVRSGPSCSSGRFSSTDRMACVAHALVMTCAPAQQPSSSPACA
jgi:hypothetical protein